MGRVSSDFFSAKIEFLKDLLLSRDEVSMKVLKDDYVLYSERLKQWCDTDLPSVFNTSYCTSPKLCKSSSVKSDAR